MANLAAMLGENQHLTRSLLDYKYLDPCSFKIMTLLDLTR
jgi:hypothetical protein